MKKYQKLMLLCGFVIRSHTMLRIWKMMRLTVFMFIIGITQVFALDSYSQLTKLSLKFEETNLEEVLDAIEDKSEFFFLYNKDLIDVEQKVTIDLKEKKITEILDHLLKDKDIRYFVFDRQIVLSNQLEKTGFDDNINTGLSNAQQNIITGQVTDMNGNPLPGVSIRLKETNVGVVTNADGDYRIDIPEGPQNLIFSFIGMVTQEIEVGARKVIDVTMEEETIGIDEVVVVGYGTQKKMNLTGSLDVVSDEELVDRPQPTMGALLQGQSPNTLLTMGSYGGEPGQTMNIQIRGVGSISGNTRPLVLMDGVEMDMNLVDPENVESITILKDASAAAVYGSRAAFGVILIQTKKGAPDQPMRITYNTIVSANVPYYVPGMTDSYSYAMFFNQAAANSGSSPAFSEEHVERIKAYIDGTYEYEYDLDKPPYSIWRGRWDGNANYDWLGMYFRDYSIQQKHNINVEGGDEKTQYYISGGFLDQPGIYEWGNDKYNRHNVVGNVSTQVANWLNFNFNAKYARTYTDHPNGGLWGGGRTGVWQGFNVLWPTMPRWNHEPDNYYSSKANPIEVLMEECLRTETDNNNFHFTLGGVLEPLKEWETTIRYTYNYRAGKTVTPEGPIYVDVPNGTRGNIGRPQTRYTETLRTGNYNLFTAYTQYAQTINKHYFSGMVGYEQDYNFNQNLWGNAYDLVTSEVPSISTALGTLNVSDGINHWATQGVFGRFNYNFDEKYLLEFSARYDGSSRFAPEQRWGFFPSVSAGYNIARENFWKSVESYVQMLKLRVSYGSLGNQNVANYLYLSTVPIRTNLGRIMDEGRPNYADIPPIQADNLTWETVTTFNLGLDASFFNNRLLLGFDRYERITDNMIGPTETLPSVLGTGTPQTNNAKLSTRGFELTLGWRDRLGEFVYNAEFSLGDYQTTILEYRNENGRINTWYKGKKHGDIWGLTTWDIIQEEDEQMWDQSYYYPRWGPGDIKYQDLDGNEVIDPGSQTLDDHGDLSIIANTTPRYQIGFNGSVKWKSWDFNMFWQGLGRRDVVPSMYHEYFWGVENCPSAGIVLKNSSHLDYWRPANETNDLGPNTDAYFPKPYRSWEIVKNREPQTRYIQNAAYIRLKNLQIGYSLPLSVISRTPIKKARLYFSGENLWTYTPLIKPFEPELMVASGGNFQIYPIQQMFSLGLNISF
jgi:TonB-linked SusC/RagA family outer membrane protein